MTDSTAGRSVRPTTRSGEQTKPKRQEYSTHQIRPATKKDIPRLAEIGFKAFSNEPIDAQWFPLKDLYPSDYRRAFIEEFNMRMVTPGHLVMVLEVEVGDDKRNKDDKDRVGGKVKKSEEDDKITVDERGKAGQGKDDEGPTKEEKKAFIIAPSSEPNQKRSRIAEDETGGKKKRLVVAYAVFVKHGPNKTDLANWSPDSLNKKIDRIIFNIKTAITSRLRPNRAACPETYRIYYEQAAEVYKQHMEEPVDQQRWIDCRGLAVDPAYQRRGYGENLIDWLGHAAWTEDVPVFGDSTATGLPLYLRNGCEVIGKIELKEKVVDAGKGEREIKVAAVEATLLMWKA